MPPRYPIQLVILDDLPIMRAGLLACLQDALDMEVKGDFGTLAECVAASEKIQPDIVLIGHLHRGNLTDAISELKKVSPALRVAVLSTHGGSARARMAIDAGADGFMLQCASAADLAEGLRMVARGHRFLDNATAMEMANSNADDDLRPREIEVLRRVAAGRANKQIADEMSTTEGTVKNVMKRILLKLDAADRTHAVVIAARRGFISVHQ
jgi:DNA-binding NarL/FixJ family response regulator